MRRKVNFEFALFDRIGNRKTYNNWEKTIDFYRKGDDLITNYPINTFSNFAKPETMVINKMA